MRFNSQDWKKALLAGGLVLMLVYGLCQIPEVWVRSPESLWKDEIPTLQKESLKIAAKLESAHEVLDGLQGKSLSRSSANRLHLAQKYCVSVEIRERYLEAKLAALKAIIEKKIPGAAPTLASELHEFLAQINEMQLQSGQCRLSLASAQKKLRTVKLALAARK
jgi:hypothetical protein